MPLASSGARGLARSRSRTVSSWGRPAVAETAHLTKTGGRPSKAYSRGDPSLAASVSPESLHTILSVSGIVAGFDYWFH